jgi:hypothetical protein
VPVDGSQQTLFRSSPAGTHRTLVRTYFQNPASPSSNFSNFSKNAAARAQHFILGYELCFSLSTIFVFVSLLFFYRFLLWKPEIQDAPSAEPPSRTSIQFDLCEDDTIIRYHSFDRSVHEQRIVSDISSTLQSLLPLILHWPPPFRPISLGKLGQKCGDREDCKFLTTGTTLPHKSRTTCAPLQVSSVAQTIAATIHNIPPEGLSSEHPSSSPSTRMI